MDISGAIVVVTGAASGIGRALCARFAGAGARCVVAADIDGDGAAATARMVAGIGIRCDVTLDAEIALMVADVEARVGPIALFCSNAGVALFDEPAANCAGAPDGSWTRSWAVNVMAHVHAARHMLPRMTARGGGYFLNTVSAAGLLSQIGSAAYATTKHAAIGFAENLAISHRDEGIRVSVLCPQGVDTPMLRALPQGPQHLDGVLTAEAVAEAALEGVVAERFLILPHPEVATYLRRKVDDYDRWIGGMAKLRRRMRDAPP
ncbi:MAG: SDR family oxidoreductase [Alphaproteobacteria bacterium]|nr:SDR family oxidoreductase [Alphaproteobacteria bacterium]